MRLQLEPCSVTCVICSTTLKLSGSVFAQLQQAYSVCLALSMQAGTCSLVQIENALLDQAQLFSVQIRVQDNVKAQHKLVTEKFGIKKLVMVIGWSMGAGQTFQWGVRSFSNQHSSHFSAY